MRLVRTASTVLAITVVSACGGQPPESAEETLDVAQAEEPAPDQEESTELRRFLPDALQRSTRAETFPHGAHREIDCLVCHQIPPGHGSHGDLSCAQCHRASALSTVRALSPADCQACHHGAQQTVGCVGCHDAPGRLVSSQLLDLTVWDAPRRRSMDFDHGLHGSLTCDRCHRGVEDVARVDCASCHDDHHTPDVRCQSCHVPPPETAHDATVHLTCSGSGCHAAPTVEAFASTRTVCLVCHQEQEDHESGVECIRCHTLSEAAPVALIPTDRERAASPLVHRAVRR